MRGRTRPVGLMRRGGREGGSSARSARAFGTLVVDLDFSRSDLITLNGSNISQINGASGTAYDFSQATAINQPAYAASDADFNGRGSVSFAGSHLLASTSTIAIASGKATVVCVCKPNVAAGTTIFWEIGPALGNNRGQLARQPGNWEAYYQAGGGGSTLSAATTTNTKQYASLVLDTSVANTPMTLYNGSTSVGSYSATLATAGSIETATWTIGARSGVVIPTTGKLARFLVYSEALSASRVASLYTWLLGLYG